MAKNMVVKPGPKMTGGAGGGTGRLEKSAAVGGKMPGSMGMGMKGKK